MVRVAGKNAVRATYRVKLRNASGFDVYVKGFEAHDALFPTYMPSDVPSVELKFNQLTPPLPPGEILIGSGGTVDCEIRIHYYLNVVNLAPGGDAAGERFPRRPARGRRVAALPVAGADIEDRGAYKARWHVTLIASSTSSATWWACLLHPFLRLAYRAERLGLLGSRQNVADGR